MMQSEFLFNCYGNLCSKLACLQGWTIGRLFFKPFGDGWVFARLYTTRYLVILFSA
jgi:hypothetical protein